MADRYADLSPEARAFLESISSENVADLHAAFRFYGHLPEPAKKFLTSADAETLTFLARARKEEIKQLEATIRLMSSAGTVGRFLFWVLGTFFGALILMAQFGDALAKLWALMRGGVK